MAYFAVSFHQMACKMIEFSQKSFTGNLKHSDRGFSTKCKTSVRPPGVIRTHGGGFSGSMMRLLQPRYDMACDASSISPMHVVATKGPDMLSKVIGVIVKAWNTPRRTPSVFLPNPSFLKGGRRIRPTHVVSPEDAKYLSLPTEWRAESGFTTPSIPIRGTSQVKCIGHAPRLYSHRVSRVVRSSIAAACVALSHAIDYTIWRRSLVMGV